MKASRRFLPIPLFILLAIATVGEPAASDRSPASADPPPISGMEDAGTYRFYLNEEVLATTGFSWSPRGAYEGSYTLAMAGQSVSTSIRIEVDDRGIWTAIEMETPGGPVSVARQDSIARITKGEAVTTVNLKPGTILFENFNPALMTLALRAYDREKGGKQVFPIFIIPAVVMDASLERKEPVERMVAGRDLLLERYVYGLPGVDVTLYVDPQGKIVFGDVPSQHGAYVREGYEPLLRSEAVDPLLSKPDHEVAVLRNVMTPMRDGVKLAADIYRPDSEGRFPVVLVRTPYSKEMNELQGRFFARRGYVYVVQDCRGRFSSEGEWEPFVNESRDGYDTVEWAAAQPWSSGKVGMIGASYLGWVQWWAARDRPPHLTTIIPNVAPPDPFFNIPYEYGVFFLMGAIWWADILESEATGELAGTKFREISEKKYARLLRDLPVLELDEKVLGKPNPYWRKWIDHPAIDSYWEQASFLDHLETLDIPVFHQSGWFDGDGIGSKLNYLRMASHGHCHQKLVLGPWGHTDTAHRRVGRWDFGEAAIVDLQRDYLRWLDRWLKGIENGIDEEPLVSVFLMGSNRWMHGDTYPLPGTEMSKLYLSSGGKANTSNGDGTLVWEIPAAGTPPDRFIYDPGDPTPSPGFYVDPEDLEESVEQSDPDSRVKSIEEEREKRHAYYATVNEERPDILVYETEEMSDSLSFVGPISAVLYAATSAKDTDWFMRLARVDAEGGILPLAEGKIRARFRRSFREPEPVRPGEVEEYRLDLWQTGITVLPGEKLRVEVASAAFPLFSRNLNTGGANEKETEFVRAEQTIYHDAGRPSHLLLPVVREPAR